MTDLKWCVVPDTAAEQIPRTKAALGMAGSEGEIIEDHEDHET
jgi:hypothetical protein